MKTKTILFSNLIWRFAERIGAQAVSFVVSILLARILEPEAYGSIALIIVFTNILQVFVDSGLGNALIQKQEASETDFSTVFYVNLLFCLVLYGLMFFLAPYLAVFYENQSLTPLIRVLSLTIILSGIKNVQQAYVSRNMLFKKFFFSTLGGTIVAAVVGIALALSGFGVWALVWEQLTNAAIDTLILWFTVRWRPTRQFSFQNLKILFSYGWKLLASNLLNTVYKNIRQLIIGYMYSATDLAYYNRGEQFPNLIVTNLNTSIDSILFPALSKLQTNPKEVRRMTRQAIKISVYVMAPMMVGLAFTASSVISLIFTDKWMPCVPYLRIFCFIFMIYPIHAANLNAIKALGRSDLFLKLEMIKKAVELILLLASIPYGVKAMAYSLLLSSILGQVINAWPNQTLLHYGYLEQLKDIFPSILSALLMGCAVFLLTLLHWGVLLTLISQIILGILVYLLLSVLLKNDSFFYLLSMIRGC